MCSNVITKTSRIFKRLVCKLFFFDLIKFYSKIIKQEVLFTRGRREIGFSLDRNEIVY